MDERIAFALRQTGVGTPVEEVCWKMGISDATFHDWRKKQGGLCPSELRRRKPREKVSRKFKRPMAGGGRDEDLALGVGLALPRSGCHATGHALRTEEITATRTHA